MFKFLDLDATRQNPSLGGSEKVRLKPVCLAIETSKKIKILHVASIDIILSNEPITMVLIRCAGWSVPLLITSPEDSFSQFKAHLIAGIYVKHRFALRYN